MEESKAAAYYDELSRRGEGAARFKQGLGFSAADSGTDIVSTAKGSALPSSSSFLSSFVKASSPSKAEEFRKQAEVEAVQNKLKKKKSSLSEAEGSRSRISDRGRRESRSPRRRRSRSRERDSDRRNSKRRSRSRERYRDSDRDRDRDRERRRRRRSRSDSDGDRRRRRRSSEEKGLKSRSTIDKQSKSAVDYSRLIEGYDKMSSAERVKAKMKLQLAQTAEKDETKSMGSGWERFEFNKDAPLDDEEEVEAAEDDSKLVKRIGQSFRFTAVEAKREEQIKAAHDEAMFGAPIARSNIMIDSEIESENDEKESNESEVAKNLLSEKVLAKQQGSWRDRFRKV